MGNKNRNSANKSVRGDDFKLDTQTASSNLAIRYRESILTEAFEKYDIKYVYRCFVNVVCMLYIRTVLKEWDSGDTSSYGFGLFKSGFHDINYTFKIWLCLITTNFLVHPFLCFWGKIRSSFLPKTGIILKIWDMFWLSTVIIYIICIIYIPLHIRGIPTAVASNIALIAEQLRLVMKTHAFVRSNVPKFLNGKDDKILKTPKFTSYLYYLFAPTFIYQDDYQRAKFNWKRVRNLSLEFLMLVYFFSAVVAELCESFRDIGLKPQTKISLLLLYVKSVFIGTILHHTIFYVMLHNWSNLWAEILRFPDRQFYQDWWTACNSADFYRKWNIIIYAYLHTYIYKDTIKIFKNKLLAALMTLIMSSAMHEFFVYASSNLFIPTMTIQMLVVSFGLSLVVSRFKLNENVTNYMMIDWWTTFLAPDFYRKWNTLVYGYLHTYLYKDFVIVFKNKLFATFLVVVISGAFHEVFLYYAAGVFIPIITVKMLFLSFVLTPLTNNKPVSEIFSNYMLIITMFLSLGTEVFTFFFNYFNMKNEV